MIKAIDEADNRPTLRGFLLNGHFFIAAALARTLTKLCLKYIKLADNEPVRQNRFIAESMFIMAAVLHYGKSGLAKKAINEDDTDSINVCLRIVSERSALIMRLFDDQSKQALTTLLDAKLHDETMIETDLSRKLKGKLNGKNQVQADEPLRFGQLTAASDFGDKEDVFDLTLKQAIGALNKKDEDFLASSKLNKVFQLTGFSDPVYAEAYVHVNQYDIVLDVLVVNQTGDTLQNLMLELATLGDLKLVEKPQALTLAPRDFANIKANIKVASTENGVIFGRFHIFLLNHFKTTSSLTMPNRLVSQPI